MDTKQSKCLIKLTKKKKQNEALANPINVLSRNQIELFGSQFVYLHFYCSFISPGNFWGSTKMHFWARGKNLRYVRDFEQDDGKIERAVIKLQLGRPNWIDGRKFFDFGRKVALKRKIFIASKQIRYKLIQLMLFCCPFEIEQNSGNFFFLWTAVIWTRVGFPLPLSIRTL